MSDEVTTVDATAADATTTVETAPSVDDTIMAEIDKIFDAADKQERQSEQATQQERGPDGKFQARDAGGEQTTETEVKQPTEQAPPAEKQDQAIPDPPEAWSSVKAHWAALPPEVRQALIDREEADQKSRTETGERLKSYESLERIIGPRRDALAQGFTSAEAAVEQLFALSDFAGRDFPGFVRWMCAQRGVDPKSLLEQAAVQAPADPTIAALQRKVETLESGLSAREQAESQEQERKAAAAIDEFKAAKSDKGELLYPHFDAVKAAMGAVLKSGAASSLAQAYKMALAADDKLQAKIAEEAEKARKAAAEAEAKERKAKEEAEAKEKAAKAQRAARSDIRSSSGTTSASRQTLDETLKAEIDKRMGAAA